MTLQWRKGLRKPSSLHCSPNVEGRWKKASNIKFSLNQKSALTWKPVCGSAGCLWNIQRGNTLQDAGVLAHSGGSSPFFYSLCFCFPPPGNIQQQVLRGVTLILQDSAVRPHWKCLPFNPGNGRPLVWPEPTLMAMRGEDCCQICSDLLGAPLWNPPLQQLFITSIRMMG